MCLYFYSAHSFFSDCARVREKQQWGDSEKERERARTKEREKKEERKAPFPTAISLTHRTRSSYPFLLGSRRMNDVRTEVKRRDRKELIPLASWSRVSIRVSHILIKISEAHGGALWFLALTVRSTRSVPPSLPPPSPFETPETFVNE